MDRSRQRTRIFLLADDDDGAVPAAGLPPVLAAAAPSYTPSDSDHGASPTFRRSFVATAAPGGPCVRGSYGLQSVVGELRRIAAHREREAT